MANRVKRGKSGAKRVKRVATKKKKIGRPVIRKRGDVHMSTRVHRTDKAGFVKVARQRAVPQSELFRRFVAAIGRAGAKTRAVTIRITGYSPL